MVLHQCSLHSQNQSSMYISTTTLENIQGHSFAIDKMNFLFWLH